MYMCVYVFAIWNLSFSMDNAFKSQGLGPGKLGQTVVPYRHDIQTHSLRSYKHEY